MNRTDLGNLLATSTGESRSSVDAVLDGLERLMLETVREGSELRWPGLFILDVVERAPRRGRNPATGAAMEIPARTQPRLRLGTRIKSAARRQGSS